MAYRLDKTDNSIVIDGFEAGIADSPYSGISDMRNIDIISVPGEGSVAMSTQAMQSQAPITTVTFTVDPATNIFTYNGVVPLEVNTAILFFNTGGALPAGIFADRAYYILTTPTSTTFTVSDVSAGGAVVDVTGAGSGTNTFSTIQMGTPQYFTSTLITPNDVFRYYYFMGDSDGRAWVYDSVFLGGSFKWVYMHNRQPNENVGFSASINGMSAYRGYLFLFNPNDIDVIPLINYAVNGVPDLAGLTTRTRWTFGWQTLLSSTYSTISHESIISQNDSDVYICNGQFIASISEIPGSLSAELGYNFNITETKTIANGITTNGSQAISTTGSFFRNTDVGAVIVGTNIPVGTVIGSVTDSRHATLAAEATSGTGSGLTFTITRAYDYTADILTLPINEQATCITELGDNLLIGGINNYIYPWDRISTNFNIPIFLSENHAYQMVTVNTNTYIFSGERGRIFVTNGSQADLWKKIPDHISGTVNPFYTWKGATFNRNQLYFGFSVKSNTGTTINQYGGLWAIDTDTKAMRLLNQLSYGTYAGYASAVMSYRGDFIGDDNSNDGYGLFIGWNNGSVGGIDKGISTPYTNSKAQIVSDLIPIGTFDLPKDMNRLEYKLTRPLVAGESIAIYARLIFDTSDTGFGTAILTDNTAGNFSKSAPINFKNAQWLQLQAITNSTASSPSYTRLKEFRIR